MASGQQSLPSVLSMASIQNCRWTWLLCHRWWTDDTTFTRGAVKVSITYVNRHWRILTLLTAVHLKKELVSAYRQNHRWLSNWTICKNKPSCGIQYADFLERTVPLLLEDVPLNTWSGNKVLRLVLQAFTSGGGGTNYCHLSVILPLTNTWQVSACPVYDSSWVGAQWVGEWCF
jgi:hypothetical protein